MSKIRLAQYGGYIFLVRTAMTPTQVEIVQDNFRLVSRQPHEASRIFYDELFALSPELRPLFPEEMSEQKTKFMQMLTTIVKSLDHVARISDHMLDLGRRHMSYDIEEEHYSAFGEAFLSMLDRLLGPELTPEIRDAWSAAYDMFARIMQEASVVPNTAEGFFGTIIRSVLTSQYGITIRVEGNVAGRAPITHGIERGEVIRFSGQSIYGADLA
jgi:hemoglobin-like flavoprotein